MNKYFATITGIGVDAPRLVEKDLCIIFNNNAPPELAEISVLHTIEELKDDVRVGDSVKLGDQVYPVIEVGDEANRTLRELGHCSMWLHREEGMHRECLPGYIVLKCSQRPKFALGDTIEIDG